MSSDIKGIPGLEVKSKDLLITEMPLRAQSRELKFEDKFMAVRGRKPTATIIKLATGNPGRRALPQREPPATGVPIKPPKIGKRAGLL